MINNLMMLLSSTISVVLYTICYTSLSNIKFKINIKNICLIILGAVFIIINTELITSTFILILSTLITLTSIFYIMYKENILKLFIRVLIICSIAMFYEIILSILLTKINIFDINSYNNNLLIKTFFSTIVLLFDFLTLNIKKLAIIINSLIKKEKDKIQFIILMISVIFLAIIDIKYSINFDKIIYYTNVFLIIFFITFLIISIYSNNKAKKEMEKIDTLLEFMKKYEKTIDDDRINRHEMLNNLLILKSFKDKNTSDFDDTLNEFINIYNNKSINPIRNIYKLPSGLKGIIYYKMKDAEMACVKFNVNISSKVAHRLKKISNNDYVRLCKLMGITLDNAIEASKLSNKKLVLLEAYILENTVHISISNTCKTKVNLDKINIKNYSSKGKGRGLGLYVASIILKNNKNIEMKQSFENYIFTTEIVIK